MSENIKGLRELRVKVDQLRQATPEMVMLGLKAGAQVIRVDAAKKAPRKSGFLRSSIHVEEAGKGAVRIGTDVVYAAIHEFGGVILPKVKKILAWEIPKKGSGVWRFAKRVRMPARPYLRPAMDEKREAVRKKINKVIAHLLKRKMTK